MEATAIKDAFNAADLFMQDEEQRLAYVNREMAIMDYKSDMNAYREEGREEGTTDAIRRLFLSGEISSDTIMKTFGWTKEQVEALKKRN